MGDLLEKIEKTLRHHTRRAMRGARSLRWRLAHPSLQRPVFVVGCSRAGTTLVYKTLSMAEELGSLQRETHDFWNALHPIEARGWTSHRLAPELATPETRAYVSRYFFVWTGKTRAVDKNNQNGLCVAFLRRLYPDALFVYVKREPGDNLLSLIEGWRRPDEFATWSGALPAEVRIDNGRFRQWCFFLPEGWREYLSAPLEEVCALQYESINRAILDDKSEVPASQWVEVFYEDLVRDPVESFRRIFAACDLGFGASLRAHCATVLARPYNAFSAIGVEKWRASADRERIERVLPHLSVIARRMGYGAT